MEFTDDGDISQKNPREFKNKNKIRRINNMEMEKYRIKLLKIYCIRIIRRITFIRIDNCIIYRIINKIFSFRINSSHLIMQ